MKEKILVALKTKYKTFGFGDKAFDGVADYLSKTVTEESQIETAISGVEGLLKSFQGDIDTVRNAKSGLQKELDELKKKIENADKDKDKDKDKDVPAWAQALIDSNKSLSEKLTAYEAEKAQAQRNSQISAVAKKYGIPEFMLKDRNIPENTDLDTYFKDMKQDMSNNGFQFSKAPETAEQKQEKEASEFAKMIEADTKSIVEQQNK
nr:MAG TPA: hypothetical protein [Caudoviricetes sp.]